MGLPWLGASFAQNVVMTKNQQIYGAAGALAQMSTRKLQRGAGLVLSSKT
jgi:hypothetical protein